MFVKSVDAFEYVKSEEKIHELLNTFIEEIEENDVIFYSRAMRLKEVYMEEFYN